MISPRIQKELANACVSEVTLAIVKDIGDRVFTILVDEARDVSLKEQMSVVLRYVNSEGYVIERFLGGVHVTDTCSHSLDQETTLVRPGDTRWGSHYSTLLRLCSMWPVVEKVLEIVRDDATILDNRSTTEGLIERMDNYEFVFTLHLMKHLLGTTNELSHTLQRKDQNIVQGISLIQSVKHQLQSFREDGWEALLDQTNRFCELHNISQVNMEDIIPRPGRKKHGAELITNLHHYQVVDLIIQEMNNRFSEASTDLLKCIVCLDPRNSFSEFNEHQVIHIATLYPEDFSASECLPLPRQVSNFIANVQCDPQFIALSDLGSFAMTMVKTKKHLVFLLAYRIIELTLILPVATASIERAFSAMKTIKTDLRNPMGNEWMNDV
ncbi:uncharacterized protein LOC121760696 [Salvia splendens]|uniref:uncharacterized protein LOC121760696 n=1 Tax=Salvia splendens TaxID=180675 RepID=UPI001C25C267|nr:uncharacterized protein LOC121760696 [Salvia splendens]